MFFFLLKYSNNNSSEVAGCTPLCSRHPRTHLKSQTSRSDLNWGYPPRHQFNMELLLCFYCNDQLRISTSETSGGCFTASKRGPAKLPFRKGRHRCVVPGSPVTMVLPGLPCVWPPSTDPPSVPGRNCEQGSC